MIRRIIRNSRIPYSILRTFSSQDGPDTQSSEPSTTTTTTTSTSDEDEMDESSRFFPRFVEKDDPMITNLFSHIPEKGPRNTRNLRFRKFVEKMEQIYISERNYQKDMETMDRKFTRLFVSGKMPLHDIFKEYSAKNREGYQGRLIAKCLKGFSDTLKSRGTVYITYHDYSHKDLLESWQFYHLLENIKHTFKLTTFIIPHDISNVFFVIL